MLWICSGAAEDHGNGHGGGNGKAKGNGFHMANIWSQPKVKSNGSNGHGVHDLASNLLSRLDDEIWPALRSQLVEVMHACIEHEVAAARELLMAEHSEMMANLDAREAALSNSQRELKRHREAANSDRRRPSEPDREFTGNSERSDVLRLNIGGEKTVSVQRGTLCAITGSKLAHNFSGRLDNALPHDDNGAFFVDFDPELFLPLLAYLRMRRINDPGTPQTIPSVAGRDKEFQSMLKFFGIGPGGQARESTRANEETTLDPSRSKARFHEETSHTSRSLAWNLEGSRFNSARAEVTKAQLLEEPHSSTFRTSAQPMVEPSFCFARSSVAHLTLSSDGLTVTRTGHPHWRRAFGDKVVNRTLLDSNMRVSFRVISFGSPPDSKEDGPHLGFAEGSSYHRDDDGAERNPKGMYTYRVRDGRLLAPATRCIVGSNPRSRAHVGDLLTFIVHADGQIGLEKNGRSIGMVFKNVPDNVTPVVEMNTEGCKVELVP